MDLLKKLAALEQENARLNKENSELKQRLNAVLLSQEPRVTYLSNSEKKIALYMNLFRSRTDIFARMWIDKNGRANYSPAKKNGIYEHLTEKVIYQHLAGERTIGLYPITVENLCYFLAVDFDKTGWQADVQAFSTTCHNYSLPCYIERSRSGNGAHVWFFFTDAVEASLARNLGKFLLKKTTEKSPNRDLDSFDRLFPSQDTLSKGGFGNLIALPLQRKLCKLGNTVFLDEQFQPFTDQWAYLARMQKISEQSIKNIVEVEPLKVNNSKHSYVSTPKNITIRLSNMIEIAGKQLPKEFLLELQQLASFNNPAYYKAQARRMSTKNIPRKIDCSDMTDDLLLLPRGLFKEVTAYLNDKQIQFKVVDDRNKGSEINIHFHGTLKLDQEEAVTSLMGHDIGVLAAGTGFGKTVVSTALIARNQINTLIIVDRTILIDQWKESLSIFLNIPIKSIGQIGGGKNNPTGKIDIAMIQSLNRQGQVKREIFNYGHVIIDECHHISAVSFEKVLKHVSAKRVYGLTATPVRKDGLHPIIHMHCGKIRYKTNPKIQAEQRTFHHRLIIRKTNLNLKVDDLQKIYSLLSKDEERNNMIFNDVLEALEQKQSPIVLTERLEHLKVLENKFKAFVKNLIVLSGNMKKKERKVAFDRMDSIPDDEEMLIISTGKFIGEGFDHSRLDSLFLTMPISWKGTLQQYVGRLHRDHVGKGEVRVYDYVDEQIPILQKMYQNRLKGYRLLGYTTDEQKGKITKQLKLFE